MRRAFTFALFVVGLLVMFLPYPMTQRLVRVLVQQFRVFKNISSTQPALVTEWKGMVFGVFQCGSGHTGIRTKLKLTIEHPETTLAGDSFLVSAIVHVQEVEGVFLDSCGRTLPWNKFSTEEMQTAAEQWLSNGKMGFALAMAGADVQPSLPQVARNSKLTWSVYPKGPGMLSGFIIPLPTDVSYQDGRAVIAGQKIEFDTHIDDNLTFHTRVKENLFRPSALVSSIVSFFGALLTLPGILTFFRERKSRRDIKRKKQEEERRIIMS